jgi:hypothetical protein
MQGIFFDDALLEFFEISHDKGAVEGGSDACMLRGIEFVSRFGIGDTHRPNPLLANHMADPMLKSMCVDSGLIKVTIRCRSTITSLYVTSTAIKLNFLVGNLIVIS